MRLSGPNGTRNNERLKYLSTAAISLEWSLDARLLPRQANSCRHERIRSFVSLSLSLSLPLSLSLSLSLSLFLFLFLSGLERPGRSKVEAIARARVAEASILEKQLDLRSSHNALSSSHGWSRLQIPENTSAGPRVTENQISLRQASPQREAVHPALSSRLVCGKKLRARARAPSCIRKPR